MAKTSVRASSGHEKANTTVKLELAVVDRDDSVVPMTSGRDGGWQEQKVE